MDHPPSIGSAAPVIPGFPRPHRKRIMPATSSVLIKRPARLLVREEPLLRFLARERIICHHVLDPLDVYRSLHCSRTHRITSNILIARFERHGSRHADQRRFASDVAQAIHRGLQTVDR